MRKKVREVTIDVNGKVVNVGIDVHKVSWDVTAMVEGVIVFSGTCCSNYETLRLLLKRYAGATLRVAYEAGCCGFWLHDQLSADGIECLVVPPSLIPTEAGNKVKTDRIDSKKLARLLEGNLLKKVHVFSPQERADRQLVRTRRIISNHRTAVMCQTKSLLLFHGVDLSEAGSGPWSAIFVQRLRELDLGLSELNRALRAMLDLYDYLTQEKVRLTQEIAGLGRQPRYAHRVNLLTSIPGVGRLSAMEILVELQDVSRFRRADELAAYLGLTPSQHSSGERTRMGHITHTGNTRVRAVLVESSWFLIAKDASMRAKYEKIRANRGGKRAIVAIARLLSMRIRRMLLDDTVYRIEQRPAA